MIAVIVLMFAVRLGGASLRRSLRNENTVASMRRSYAAWDRSRKMRYY